MFFYLSNCEKAKSLIFKAFNICNLASLTATLFSGVNKETIVFSFLVVSSCFFNLIKKYTLNSLSLIYSSFISLSVILPCGYILYNLKTYEFGYEIGFSLPYKNQIYTENIFSTIWWVSIINILVSIVICFSKKAKTYKKQNVFINENKYLSVFLVTLVVLFVNYIKSLKTIQAFADPMNDGASLTSYLSLLTSDTVYLVIFSLWIFQKRPKFADKAFFLAVLLCFSLFDVILCGSKGSFLKIFNYCYLIPIAFLTRVEKSKIIVPSFKSILLTFSLSLYLFNFSKVYRNQLFEENTSLKIKIENTFEKISQVNSTTLEIFIELFHKGMVRQSADFDRLCIITQDFLKPIPQQEGKILFFYISKNLINQLLPGTPFPESYNPSSNMFEKIIFLDKIDKTGSIEEMGGTNTQPFTLFGLMTILAGNLAIIPLIIITYIASATVNSTQNPVIGMASLIFYKNLLHCYGFEIVIKELVICIISIYFFIFIFRILNKFQK